MEKNVGGKDRIARWVAGGTLAVYGATHQGWRRWIALTAAGSLLGTAGTRKCLVNRLCGVNTANA